MSAVESGGLGPASTPEADPAGQQGSDEVLGARFIVDSSAKCDNGDHQLHHRRFVVLGGLKSVCCYADVLGWEFVCECGWFIFSQEPVRCAKCYNEVRS